MRNNMDGYWVIIIMLGCYHYDIPVAKVNVFIVVNFAQ